MSPESAAKELRAEADLAFGEGRITDATVAIESLWRDHAGPSTAAFINARASRLGARRNHRRASVALLRSFTVEPVVPLLRAAALLNRLELTVHIGDFNAYTQEILNPSSDLYTTWKPDVTVLAVQTRDIAPELWEGFTSLDAEAVTAVVDRVADEFSTMIRVFRQRSSAMLVVHQLEVPSRPAAGVADAASANGQIASIRAINERIAAVAAAHTSVYPLDYDALIARAGRSNWFDPVKWSSMRMPIRAEHLRDLADEWLSYIQPAIGHTCKAIVVDLDNTLWGGVLGEDGIDGVHLSGDGDGADFRALHRTLLDMRARGILLGICSKNNESEVRDMFDRHPASLLRWSDFVVHRINWLPKSGNLGEIAAELNIGLDSIAFLDDNPAECDLIRRDLPDVLVIPARHPAIDAASMATNPFFQRLTITAEDQQRSTMYAEQQVRRELEDSSDSLEGFLHSLQMRVDIHPATAAEVGRVAQLTQKTNQFNMTTKRYSEGDIERMMSDDSSIVYTTSASDRFGDHGLIGVVIAKMAPDVWDIDTMLLSCRVIGRGVETAMLARLVADASAKGASRVRGTFIETLKNAPAKSFFADHGFAVAGPDGDASMWLLPIDAGTIPTPTWIESVSLEESRTHAR